MKAVFESRQEFFQQWMAEGVVQDNSQTLGRSRTQTTSRSISRLLPIKPVMLIMPAVTIMLKIFQR